MFSLSSFSQMLGKCFPKGYCCFFSYTLVLTTHLTLHDFIVDTVLYSLKVSQSTTEWLSVLVCFQSSNLLSSEYRSAYCSSIKRLAHLKINSETVSLFWHTIRVPALGISQLQGLYYHKITLKQPDKCSYSSGIWKCYSNLGAPHCESTRINCNSYAQIHPKLFIHHL
jgi:hypothetical protein